MSTSVFALSFFFFIHLPAVPVFLSTSSSVPFSLSLRDDTKWRTMLMCR